MCLGHSNHLLEHYVYDVIGMRIALAQHTDKSLLSILQEWALELEDVYAVDREGETDHYVSFKESLDNKMLLWHGKFLPCLTSKVNL